MVPSSMMMISSAICVLLVFGCVISAFPGEYVAKSYYFLDSEGHKSVAVPLRAKRELLRPLLRFRRGGGGSGAAANSQASATAHSASGGGGQYGTSDYNPALAFPDFAEFAQNFPAAFGNLGGGGGGKGGAYSFASSHSSSSAGGGGGGNGGKPQGGSEGLGSGHDVGYKGPILFSRFGEDQGTGVEVSGSAQGPKGAFSSSSSAIDSTGKIKYSVQSGKY